MSAHLSIFRFLIKDDDDDFVLFSLYTSLGIKRIPRVTASPSRLNSLKCSFQRESPLLIRSIFHRIFVFSCISEAAWIGLFLKEQKKSVDQAAILISTILLSSISMNSTGFFKEHIFTYYPDYPEIFYLLDVLNRF